MSEWFSEDMTSNEARKKLFSLLKENSGRHEEILNDYHAILSVITKKELNLAKEGWML